MKTRIILSFLFFAILAYQVNLVNIITYEIAILLFIVVPIIIYYFVSKVFR